VGSGARSWTEIGEFACELTPEQLARLGARASPYTGRYTPPDEATIRRALQRVDAQAPDRLVGGWLGARQPPAAADDKAVAVDGKTLRGAVDADRRRVHLLAALDQQQGTVLAQRRVDGKSNEITGFQPLLEEVDLEGAVSPRMRCTASGLTLATWSPSGTRTTCLWPRRTSRGWWRRSVSFPSRRFPPPGVTVERGHGGLERAHGPRRASARAGLLPPRRAGAGGRPARERPGRRVWVNRGRLRGDQPGLHPGGRRPAGWAAAGAVVDREPAALGA
jgi:hypothetical protein